MGFVFAMKLKALIRNPDVRHRASFYRASGP